MKNVLLTLCLLSLLWGCSSDDYQECYEPLYLNETDVEVSFIYGSIKDDVIRDSLKIKPGDTVYNPSSEPLSDFPFLHQDGLDSDVRLIFHTQPQKCLTFKGDELQKKDIRNFASYENIGSCRYCMMRGQSEPDAMLYRINEDLLKQAKPCE